MIQGTTPTFTFRLVNHNINLNAARNVYVRFKQSTKVIDKSGSDLEINGYMLRVWLTQEESLKLSEGADVQVQINWTYLDTDGVTIRRAATKPKSIPIDAQLLKQVIE